MAELPFSRRRALVYAAVLLALVVGAGRFLLPAGGAERRAAPARVELRATGDAGGGDHAARVLVHVVGAVRRPGLYRLAEGARYADAVRAAGGATSDAAIEQVNLAAPVADGLQVIVPRQAPPASQAGLGAESVDGSSPSPVSLNVATLEELDALPGVGPVTAQKILDYRQDHGAFTSVDQLDAIPGIGPARIEQLRELVVP